ncbi:hypothetical protein [Gephyromycinifex aptenodytis]|uniref:hypothetical protein n=1 Tax=Gephyromycinifex aptenodytis TaxID=2716227 RepID=UPI00144769DF|nr:hypothetical protein [Gephyromycinifex aptenodytis]
MKARMPALLALATAMAVAGCGQSETAPAAATATLASPSASESPTPSQPAETSTLAESSPTADPAVPTTASTPQPATTTTIINKDAVVPERDSGEYGDALISAWAAGDTSALGRYADPAAAAALAKAKPNANLLRTVCESNMCSYADEAGQRVTLTFDEKKVASGAQQAVTGVKIGS